MRVEIKKHLKKLYHNKLRTMDLHKLNHRHLDVVFDMTVLEMNDKASTLKYETKTAELKLLTRMIEAKNACNTNLFPA